MGRGAELARLAELCRTSRLVTLHGPGGAGKTRLAREFASDSYWVDLAPLTDPGLLPSTVAAVIGCPSEAVEVALRGRKALLVLDNCEHLVDFVAPFVVALLTRCADLTVLATSREALDVPGEALLRLGPLPVPDAARLFVERAGGAVPFSPAVSRICTELDCHPLSIELAATRAGFLGISEILERLQDRFTLLVNERGEPRHRDLRSTIGWSYDLLDPAEQALFRRLSVLPGGFGADVVLGSADLVDSLAAKSLVVASGSRFRQLESIRLFAHEQLVARGELSATRDQVVAWLASLASTYASQAFPTLDVLAPLDAERDNLLAALHWDPSFTPLLAAALAACWRERGQFTLGRALLDPLLDVDGPHRSTVLAQAAVLATDVGDGPRAVSLATSACSLDSGVALIRSTSRLAGALLAAGDAPAAAVNARSALSLARRFGRPFDLAVCLHNLAYIALHAGDLDEASACLEECLPACLSAREPWLRVGALHSAGTLALESGDLSAAESYFLDALRFETSHLARKIHSVEGLAVVAALRGDCGRAARLGAATARLRLDWGMPPRAVDPWDQRVREALAQVPSSFAAPLTEDEVVAYALAVPLGPLTPRERDVVRFVAEGRSSKQIAARLRITERTVESHVDNVRTKLGLSTRAELGAWWSRFSRRTGH
ncbi:LuxR C-terminal-related transcriptional regulator [Lentzea sp. NBRC 105346]|uniref:helix-turn-helix transcriptional regulator n=1 Tax=Lentzea sp. NBRC 105346 TaxID=3032205 RepID=UPI0025559C68|nr:LuxR C-terminal-related transcriptional regulator [Lentzea sp. NBRC 105346]